MILEKVDKKIHPLIGRMDAVEKKLLTVSSGGGGGAGGNGSSAASIHIPRQGFKPRYCALFGGDRVIWSDNTGASHEAEAMVWVQGVFQQLDGAATWLGQDRFLCILTGRFGHKKMVLWFNEAALNDPVMRKAGLQTANVYMEAHLPGNSGFVSLEPPQFKKISDQLM